jgi:flagellar motor switch protein FliN
MADGQEQSEQLGEIQNDAQETAAQGVLDADATKQKEEVAQPASNKPTQIQNTTDGDSIGMPDLSQIASKQNSQKGSSIDMLKDVELNVKIELGRAKMYVEDVLKLNEGSVVELDKLAGDPVDIFVNEKLIAKGEVLVLNDNFCVRVNQIIAHNF